jgi:hypothetical protein
VRPFLLALLLPWVAAGAEPPAWEAMVTGSVGTTLSRETPGTSATLEPDLLWRPVPTRTLEWYALIDRPFDPHQRLAVPKVSIFGRQDLPWMRGLRPRALIMLTGQDLERWSRDGFRSRALIGLELTPDLPGPWHLFFRAGPYLGLNRYAQAADGRDLARYGLSEKLTVSYDWGKLAIQFDLVFDQRQTIGMSGSGTWKNEYSTFERLGWRFAERWQAGISHLLSRGLVDEVTGYSRSLAAWDSRESRLSLFAEWTM